ncbi:MAG: RNA polymerase sigma factor [Vicinamibacterales bacterium]
MSSSLGDVLVQNHRAFLGYLERRLGDRALAEDVLQEAFVRGMAAAEGVEEEALVPWFYRVLRNAVVDQHRRRAAANRALEALAGELAGAHEPAPDLRAEICDCVNRLAATLKPEYAQALQAVDVDEQPVKAFAAAAGLSASNAGVRLHRARQALRARVAESCGTCAEHGCRDCSCGRA